MTITISDYGKALAVLSHEYDLAELEVKAALKEVFAAQERLSECIQRRDAIQVSMNRVTNLLSKDLE